MGGKPERDNGRKGIARELKRGLSRLIVLHLLSLGEAYGYEIATTLTERTDGALEVTDGTLYPVLYRLERAGLVDVRWETPKPGVPRRYYRLTKSGYEDARAAGERVDQFCRRHDQLLLQQPEGT